ncbi:MAG: DUF4145 domain-containing protein [Rhodomicrobium sp.]
MDCPHCGKAFHDEWHEVNIASTQNPRTVWRANSTLCPSCGKCTIELMQIGVLPQMSEFIMESLRAYPANSLRKPLPKEVPQEIGEDYLEACETLPISEKASAALSRRCLQSILREQGYNKRDLAQQIDDLLNETDPAKAIPTSLRETVDAIRNFGNFSAHAITDQTTLQIIPVEPEEAEWCLEILEEMFDHYYVKPAQAAARKAALNTKLAAAGKPAAK